MNIFLNADTFVKRNAFVNGLCRDKEPEVPRNNVGNNSITDTDGMFPFLFLSFFICLFIILM